MNLDFISSYFVPVVTAGCLVTGYICKKWINDVKNKYIPTIVAIEGAILNIIVSGLSIESIVYGAICGLASTGLHQAFTKLIEGGDEKDGN